MGAVRRTAAVALLLALASPGPRSAAQPKGDPPAELLERAAQLTRRGALDEAIRLLEAAVGVRPDDAEALLLLGSALSLVPRRGEAVRALLRAMELRPDDARVHATAGMALARLAEQDAALEVFRRAVALDPELGEAHLNLALILASREDFEPASEHMATALSLESEPGKLARLRFLNGKLQAERGQLEVAVEEYRHSIALAPLGGDAHLALGVALKRLLREDEALPMFQKAVDLLPEEPSARYQLALELQRRGDHSAAAEQFRKAHELQPDNRSTVYNLARSLHQSGRAEEALPYRELLATMVEQRDRARESELHTAKLHGEAVRLDLQGRYAEALERYRAVLRIEPLNSVARRNLALVLCRLGRWAEGIAELEAILRSDPGDLEAARMLAIVIDQAKQAGSPADRASPPLR